MRRHLAQPLHAGLLYRGVGVEALGDGVGDDGLALFLEEFDQALLFFDQGIDFGGFVVEEVSYGILLCKLRVWNRSITVSA